MNTILTNRIKRALQKELLKRELTEFFMAKGYGENFELPLYPPVMADLPERVPRLITRCEIAPIVDETDTALGTVKISWNLFVLGTQRLDLGSTTHAGQMDIVRAIAGEPNMQLPSELKTTPKDVIDFILKVLENSKSGFVELPPNFQVRPGNLVASLFNQGQGPGPNSSPGSFYSKR